MTGSVTTERTDYEPNRYWDDNVRAAIAGGDAFKLVAPSVDSLAFLRWVAPSDSNDAIISYRIDGHLRVMDYRSYAAPESLPREKGLAALLLRARIMLERRLFPAAARVLESAHTLAPDDPDILLNLGSTYAQLGDTASAVVMLERLVRLSPRDVEALYDLGLLRWRKGRASEARALWARLDSLAPGSDLARSARAILSAR